MPLYLSEKVESYRGNAERHSKWLLLAGAVASLGYLGALSYGLSENGWYSLVVGIVASFVWITIGIHTQEQEQTAALLQYMLEISRQQRAGSSSEV